MRQAFTLVEILIALMVFSIISVTMVGVFMQGIEIYQLGEFHRAANDEAIAVFGELDRDIGLAVNPVDDGVFYCSAMLAVDETSGTVDPNNTYAGNCAVGWSIPDVERGNDERASRMLARFNIGSSGTEWLDPAEWDNAFPASVADRFRLQADLNGDQNVDRDELEHWMRHRFLIYGVDHANNLVRIELGHVSDLYTITANGTPLAMNINALLAHAAGREGMAASETLANLMMSAAERTTLDNTANLVARRIVTRGALHFSVSAIGTTRADGTVDRIPVANSWWLLGENPFGSTIALPTAPQPDVDYYTSGESFSVGSITYINAYPSAVRVNLMLTGGGRFTHEGVVVADDGADQLRVSAMRSMSASPGSYLRIENEIVGFHGRNGTSLLINQSWDDGPLDITETTGRGALRSSVPAGGHPAGTRVYAGRQYTLIRPLAR